MITWKQETENSDGTGFIYYICSCKQVDNEYALCYSPTQNKVWFWSLQVDFPSIHMHADSWNDAETIRRMLTTKKSKK